MVTDVDSLGLNGWTASYESSESNHEEDDSNDDPYLPVVTIRTNVEESTIPVLQKRSFTGRVLPSAIADTFCASLGVDGILEKLNAPRCTPGSPIYNAWEYFIAEKCDLGTAYAHLWYHPSDIDIAKHVTEARKFDDQMRRDLLEKKEIGEYAPPRRIWDLRANRVVPSWVVKNFKGVWAISHAWVADEDLKIEMLNFRAKYVWLDVLCLRQKGQGEDPRGNTSQEEWNRREALRKEEWKVDLPIIGWVYHSARQVACYLGGLGLPMCFKDQHAFEDERCWFNRAWTLQETPHDVVIAGRTRRYSGLTMSRSPPRARMQWMLIGRLNNVRYGQQAMTWGEQILHFLQEMKRRKSSSPVDKVAGLVFLLQLKRLPVYDAGQSEEDAWTELMDVAHDKLRAIFLFWYPKPNGNGSWRPSWEQLITEIYPAMPSMLYNFDNVPDISWTTEDGDSYDGPRMDACLVQGLANETETPRSGKLTIQDFSGIEHTFRIFSRNACPIPDGQYTLLGTSEIRRLGQTEWCWVIGKVEAREGKFRKVSVIEMGKYPEAESIQNLNLYRSTKIFLFDRSSHVHSSLPLPSPFQFLWSLYAALPLLLRLVTNMFLL
ncbi:hypothetical protein EDD18DRAFT_1469290 [Armillaria luteobubalina]|uniref:Heterokaryon incompatibility domain-containing protein n=1 Tax=Armillaria luteobubalina TaxID=153913 RepID=A0AA39UCQ6_9AGAR|nr:hypothetical protein EDD18DRAFT_1469290 [Armillaria luteobubalina]